ncbi:hypothetical protein CEUSTIGMA_g8152.t1 [Chlamydomonas eustigma]|uniref:Uncharacterized protein n=1 Tax=Chlamydomonas eustigma TaxID=1157962 RepID=A0A250XC93_9CHLO|nr:hypothetical protein CEUSTIGMA_g8152.t1 [Chlamydomonas eustigma]|eukprot:GAX80717.1 hypothetical protein CEUSTIGMA_g8152.t1 [Chlamydomonas eustigma]
MASSCNRFKDNNGHRNSSAPSHTSQQICDEYQRNDATCSTEQNKCDEHVELLIAKVSAQAEEIGRLKAEVDELRAKLFAIAGVSDQGSEVKHSCITQRTFTQELCKLALSENQPRIESRRPQDSKRHEPLIVTIPMLEAACRNATLGGSDICSLTRLGDLKCGESIQDMAQEAASDGILDCTFEMYAGGERATCQSFQSRVMLPTNAASYIWMSPGGKKIAKLHALQIMNHLTHQAAAEAVAAFRRHHSYQADFRSFIRSCSEGDYSGIKSRNHSFWSDEKTSYLYVISLPCILLDEENGGRTWYMMRIWEKCEVAKINRAWALRDMLMLKGTPVPMNMVDPVTGILIWQNQTSKNEIGFHGLDNKEFWCQGQGQEGLDCLSLLFNKDEALQKEMHALLAEGRQFKRRLKIKSCKLKRMLRVEPHLSAWHDVHISLLQDPVTSKEMLLILEVDVTAAVLSEKRVEELQRQQLLLLQQILRNKPLMYCSKS